MFSFFCHKNVFVVLILVKKTYKVAFERLWKVPHPQRYEKHCVLYRTLSSATSTILENGRSQSGPWCPGFLPPLPS